jgi:hypothetical protein
MSDATSSPSPTDAEIIARFDTLYGRFRAVPDNHQPLLAHYTSIKVMENILTTSEVWFSNPLFMNDLQEMRFGLAEGTRFFSSSDNLRGAGGNDERAQLLQ